MKKKQADTQPLKVIAGAPDRPLIIGDIEIQCYVLEDETRVLTQESFLRAIGRSGKPAVGRGSAFEKVAPFLALENLKPYVSKELERSTYPILLSAPGIPKAWGYRAELLPQVCEVYLAAHDDGALLKTQEKFAKTCYLLMRGLAKVGIIALVDEATGYQRVREERALATILEKFIAKELQPWTRTFPFEFYQEIFRLKRWPGPDGQKRPIIIAQYTNDFVYDRLAPGVLEELKRLNPKLPSGYRRAKYHQWFTPDFGHPKLKEHLAAVIALMKAAPNWNRFCGDLNRALPKLNETLPLPLDED
ncbi:MAG: P63C domain-containing protein [Nitrospira sp.]|nr:P63C domain-containing protein [Nitrospira sp.]